jgi:hypothetical protein
LHSHSLSLSCRKCKTCFRRNNKSYLTLHWLLRLILQCTNHVRKDKIHMTKKQRNKEVSKRRQDAASLDPSVVLVRCEEFVEWMIKRCLHCECENSSMRWPPFSFHLVDIRMTKTGVINLVYTGMYSPRGRGSFHFHSRTKCIQPNHPLTRKFARARLQTLHRGWSDCVHARIVFSRKPNFRDAVARTNCFHPYLKDSKLPKSMFGVTDTGIA